MGLGLALAGLGALAKTATGVVQGIQANKIDRNNIRPIQQVQAEYQQNVNDADQMAKIGLPTQQYNQAFQNIQRNQNGVLTQLGRSANPGAGLASILRASNDASMGLDVQNAQARQQNQKYLDQQRGILAGQKQNAFDWNEKSKYLAQAAKAQALRGAGAQNVMSGFNDVTQIGLMAENPDYKGSSSSSSNNQPNFYNAMKQYGITNYGTSSGMAS